MTRPPTGERLIGVLVPPVVPRRPPAPVPLAQLPHRPHPAPTHEVLVDVARLEPVRTADEAWTHTGAGLAAGQRLDVDVVDAGIVVTASTAGRHRLTARGEVSLPAPARALTSIDRDAPVLLTADVSHRRLLVHPAAVVVRMLADLHIELSAGGHDVG